MTFLFAVTGFLLVMIFISCAKTCSEGFSGRNSGIEITQQIWP
jgi:hypothetical protein